MFDVHQSVKPIKPLYPIRHTLPQCGLICNCSTKTYTNMEAAQPWLEAEKIVTIPLITKKKLKIIQLEET